MSFPKKIAFMGDVDHGKSTLLGRILVQTQAIPEGRLYEAQDYCAQTEQRFEPAFLLDVFQEEREKKITADCTQFYFNWGEQAFLAIDTPGHREFLEKMVSGTSRADAVVYVLDLGKVERGLRKDFLKAVRLLKIPQLVVALTKADENSLSSGQLALLKEKLRGEFRSEGLEPEAFILVSGLSPEFSTEPLLEVLARPVKTSGDGEDSVQVIAVQGVRGRHVYARVEQGPGRGDLLIFHLPDGGLPKRGDLITTGTTPLRAGEFEILWFQNIPPMTAPLEAFAFGARWPLGQVPHYVDSICVMNEGELLGFGSRKPV